MMTLSRRRLLAGSLGAGVLSPQRAAPLRPGRAAPDRRVRERDAQRQPEPGLRGRHAREAAGATRGKAPGIRFGGRPHPRNDRGAQHHHGRRPPRARRRGDHHEPRLPEPARRVAPPRPARRDPPRGGRDPRAAPGSSATSPGTGSPASSEMRPRPYSSPPWAGELASSHLRRTAAGSKSGLCSWLRR